MKFKDCQIQRPVDHKCGAFSFTIKVKREDYSDVDRECIKEIWRRDGSVDSNIELSECEHPKQETKQERSIWKQIRDAHERHKTGYHEEWKKEKGVKHTHEYFEDPTESGGFVDEKAAKDYLYKFEFGD